MTDDMQPGERVEPETSQAEEIGEDQEPKLEEPDRCVATTTRGARCKNKALPDSRYCTVHYRLLGQETTA